MASETTTHFGFEKIPLEEKNHRVQQVFSNVSDRYDLMNDLMSLGLHRFWKRVAIELAHIQTGHAVLDVASGTGDLAALIQKRLGEMGYLILTDIHQDMLALGRDKLVDNGCLSGIAYCQANAENLPFAPDSFDCITIGFGLRNVTHKEKALASFYQALKPGGRCMLLEFSHPITFIKPMYDLYSFHVIPKLGEWVLKDTASYQYLVESIRMHPNQEQLKTMMQAAGFEDCRYVNLTGGIVAIHVGFKF